MKKQVNKILCCLLLVFCCVLSLFINTNTDFTFAESNIIEYTDVLSDLQKDTNFKKSDYVVDNTDYSLQVIQIAESENDELFVYVYQPCSPNIYLQATTINISKGIDENLSYVNYRLKLINYNGVFYKYKVANFVLESTETRYYDISSIYRQFISVLDENPQNDNTITEVAFAVGKRFYVKTTESGVTYDCLEVETIDVTNYFVGTMQYLNGTDLIFVVSNTNSHFIAFDTDKPIDKLIESDVLFTSRPYTQVGVTIFPHYLVLPINTEYGEYSTYSISLNYSQKTNTETFGVFGHTYSWERIQSVERFLETEEVPDECRNAIKDMKWVLRFLETPLVEIITNVSTVTGTEVRDVSILRLKFETNGIVYNLGVVCNKQTGSSEPVNKKSLSLKINGDFLSDYLKRFFMIVMIIILLIVLAPLLPHVISFLIWLIKGIWQVLSIPFKAIKKINKNKGGGKK